MIDAFTMNQQRKTRFGVIAPRCARAAVGATPRPVGPGHPDGPRPPRQEQGSEPSAACGSGANSACGDSGAIFDLFAPLPANRSKLHVKQSKRLGATVEAPGRNSRSACEILVAIFLLPRRRDPSVTIRAPLQPPHGAGRTPAGRRSTRPAIRTQERPAPAPHGLARPAAGGRISVRRGRGPAGASPLRPAPAGGCPVPVPAPPWNMRKPVAPQSGPGRRSESGGAYSPLGPEERLTGRLGAARGMVCPDRANYD